MKSAVFVLHRSKQSCIKISLAQQSHTETVRASFENNGFVRDTWRTKRLSCRKILLSEGLGQTSSRRPPASWHLAWEWSLNISVAFCFVCSSRKHSCRQAQTTAASADAWLCTSFVRFSGSALPTQSIRRVSREADKFAQLQRRLPLHYAQWSAISDFYASPWEHTVGEYVCRVHQLMDEDSIVFTKALEIMVARGNERITVETTRFLFQDFKQSQIV